MYLNCAQTFLDFKDVETKRCFMFYDVMFKPKHKTSLNRNEVDLSQKQSFSSRKVKMAF